MITLKGNSGIYEGLSTDTKPSDVEVNTEFHELDTDKMYYFDGTEWQEEPASGGGGGGFTPTQAQLNAMNSGITAERVSQLAGIDNSGDDYIEVNGIRLYISSTAPTGTIPDGSVGVGW